MTYFSNTYPEPLRTTHPCDFRLISSAELAEGEEMGVTVTLYLYRITINENLRNRKMRGKAGENGIPLSLDLRYLISVWAGSALVEHTIMAWVMSELNQHPILDSATLSSEAEWRSGDQVHFVPLELSTEDLMRVWDSFKPNYRLSVSYIARAVRIDPETRLEDRPVLATRYGYSLREGP